MKIVLVLLTLAPSGAFALTEEDCARLHPEIVSAAEMEACLAETDALEAELAAALTGLRAALPSDQRPAQEAAQTAWAAWRDAECAFQGAPYPGSGGTGVTIACRADLTRARIRQVTLEAEAWQP